jgi:hypothetical protein
LGPPTAGVGGGTASADAANTRLRRVLESMMEWEERMVRGDGEWER